MSVRDFVFQSIQKMQDSGYAFTRAQYTNTLTGTKQAVIESLSVSLNSDGNALVIFGDNGSCKSLACKAIESAVQANSEYEVRTVSMGNRASKSIGRAFIFGDEDRQSTGATSISGVQKAFGGADAYDEPSLIILDEPDLGLSAKYARAMGRFIAMEANRLKDKGVYVIVVSHSRELLSAFLSELPHPASYLGLDTATTLSGWLSDDEEKSIDDLLAMGKLGRIKEMAIDREIDATRKKRAQHSR